MPDKFTTRYHYQDAIVARLKRESREGQDEAGNPHVPLSRLRREAACAWVSQLEKHELKRCLDHFWKLTEDEQCALIAHLSLSFFSEK